MAEMSRRDALRLIGAGVAGLATAVSGAGATHQAPAAPILTRRISSSGETVSVIGLGTWQTFDVGPTPAERAPLEEVLGTFVTLGGKVVDSSPMYGRSEDVVGDLAAKLGLRSKLFLATKVWTSGKTRGIEQMEESMRKLRTRVVDLMQVHNLVDARTHLDTLREWKHEGRVRYLGVTHYTAGSHDDVARVVADQPLDFVQINYSVGEREAERRFLPLALERGVAVIANRPFAGGELFRRLRSRAVPAWAGEIDCDSWAQLLLKFIVSHPAITCAIPATSKVAHLRDNMKAGYGRLPDEKLRAVIAKAVVH
ncbi:MAG TPA: aldo/keto reductase [Gemmatimonadales bacterium]|nr:aldo/keto reductase [Gemmatimonadales bacterium]